VENKENKSDEHLMFGFGDYFCCAASKTVWCKAVQNGVIFNTWLNQQKAFG
jgi:hypothetical protein